MEWKVVSATRWKTKTSRKKRETEIWRNWVAPLKVIRMNKASLTQSQWFYLRAEIPLQTSTRRGGLHHLHWQDLLYTPKGKKGTTTLMYFCVSNWSVEWKWHQQTTPPYLATRTLGRHVSDGLFMLLQDLGQCNVTTFTWHVKDQNCTIGHPCRSKERCNTNLCRTYWSQKSQRQVAVDI